MISVLEPEISAKVMLEIKVTEMDLSQECRVLSIIVVMTLLLLDFVFPRKGRSRPTASFVFHDAVVLFQRILETQWQGDIHNSSACSE